MAGIEIAPIVRTQDYTIIKQNEDNKPDVDQTNYAQTVDQKQTVQNQNVVNSNETEWYRGQPEADAGKKGSNSYSGDGGSHRNEARKKITADRVIVKGRPAGGFDLKI